MVVLSDILPNPLYIFSYRIYYKALSFAAFLERGNESARNKTQKPPARKDQDKGKPKTQSQDLRSRGSGFFLLGFFHCRRSFVFEKPNIQQNADFRVHEKLKPPARVLGFFIAGDLLCSGGYSNRSA